MLHQLKRHPLPIDAHFRHALVLTYALPAAVLSPLLPAGLTLDRHGDDGFLAIALVQTEGLRPHGLPRALGRSFFLSGYRIFARYTTREGKHLRGLRILRSDTDRRLMACFGNLLTHYNYRLAEVDVKSDADELAIKIRTPDAEADLDVVAAVGRPGSLPASSPFGSLAEARRFAGPLPFTFDYEPETHSIIRILGLRKDWNPAPVDVEVRRATLLERAPFRDAGPRLANAFYVHDLDYRWEPGVREPLPA